MRFLFFIFQIFAYILERFGAFIAFLTAKFFLSPLGLILPMTGIGVILMFQYLGEQSKTVAENYRAAFETAQGDDIREIAAKLTELGDAGLESLAASLQTQREEVYNAVRETIQRIVLRFDENELAVLTGGLEKHVTAFSPAAQRDAIQWSQYILRQLAKKKTDKTNPTDAKPSYHRIEITKNCDRLIRAAETTRRRMVDPGGAGKELMTNSIAQHAIPQDTHLLIARRAPKNATGVTDELSNPFATERADRLHAYHQSPLYQEQYQEPFDSPTRRILNNDSRLDDSGASPSMIASMTPTGQSPPRFPNELLSQQSPWNNSRFPIATLAEPERKIADSYLSRMKSTPSSPYFAGHDDERSPFLTGELLRTTLDNVPNLSSAQLMRLLHHPSQQHVDAARQTLIGRDGFREAHFQLAFRLFHPSSAVRKEIVEMLPNIANIKQSVWLTELMNDPDNDVRFEAASYLATSQDPVLRKLVTTKGKSDRDPRIARLAE